MIQKVLYPKPYFCILSVCFLLFACGKNSQEKNNLTKTYFAEVKKLYLSDLDSCIFHLEELEKAKQIENLQKNYRKAREFFKKAEPIMAYKSESQYSAINKPNITVVKEEDPTNIKILNPIGFQVIEENIFGEKVNQKKLKSNLSTTTAILKSLRANAYFDKDKPYHFLWMFAKAIQRVALLNITGFDSPVLGTSLEDSRFVYQRLKEYLEIFEPKFQDKTLFDQWNRELDETYTMLKANFDDFDRYHFIKNHTNQQLKLLKATRQDWGEKFPFAIALNNDISSLFSQETFNMKYFLSDKQHPPTPENIALGKKLFNDPNLSASGNMSCATCHQKKLAFTDGLKTSKGQQRNSPTLAYAVYQKNFFYDNRSGSLEGQIVSVVKNKTEFHTDLASLLAYVKQNPQYQKSFQKLYDNKITNFNVRNAIANYVRSLAPFDAKFDRNMNELENTLTTNEINGFNLFMGKAQCATCHFAPTFNGTVPPSYTESEMELIGVPAQNTTENAEIDTDLGRYYVMNTEARKYFFKTPTLRNIAKTAPYMHNGVYNTLEEVMDFYNRGGGAGIGITLENQTLPAESLSLTDQEINDIIAFLGTLTDQSLESEFAEEQ